MANDTQDWSIRVNVDTTLSGALEVDIGDGKMILDKLDFVSTGIKVCISSPLASAGTNYRQLPALPAGQVWLIHTIFAYNRTNVCGYIRIYIETHTAPPVAIYVASRGSPPAGEGVVTRTNMILNNQDKVNAIFTGCSTNDGIYLSMFGHRLK